MMSIKNMVRGLEQDAPAKQLIRLWDHDAGTLRFWRASSNFVYSFARNGVRHFLRFIHEEDNALERIQTELDYVRYLIANGYPAAAPVRSNDGKWIETVHSEEGAYYGVVFEQAKGIYLSVDRMTDLHAEKWGTALAELHVLSESYPSAAVAQRSWDDALTFVAAVLHRHPDERGALRELEHVRGQLAELPAGPRLTGMIHYDFEADNMFYESEEARYYAIDFDDAMIHWYAMDIVSAIRDLEEQGNESARRKIERFLAGYRSVKSLDERYVRLFPLFQRFADLYTLARLLRSLEKLDIYGLPEWALTLKNKLLAACSRINERYSPVVRLESIGPTNWYACTQLEVTDEQKNVFPVPNVYWLAESAYCGFAPLAVYAGEQLAGLAVYAVDPDDGSYWMMALMVDRKFQRQGLGRSAVKELIRHMRGKHDCDKIRLGHRPGNERASRLYASLGFVEVARTPDEIVRELIFSE
ncbi:GNAT family N-acetyltransferase [Paenibacillus hodogayensis]|uniref:Bifunctional AAC/APH n=1 Tax=Paenibacillus hodogayensis TaxID=279208 RepID=A0ABV5VXZ9_9BACL